MLQLRTAGWASEDVKAERQWPMERRMGNVGKV